MTMSPVGLKLIEKSVSKSEVRFEKRSVSVYLFADVTWFDILLTNARDF